MPEKPATERTEQPTPKRLSDTRSKGNIPHSAELTSFASIAVLITMITLLAPDLVEWFSLQIRDGMSGNVSAFADTKAFINFIGTKLISAMLITAPIFLALCAGATLSQIVIGGFSFSSRALEPKLNQLNPAAGLGRLLNVSSAVKLLLSIVKLLFVLMIVWFYLKDKLAILAALRWAWSAQILAAIAKIVLGMMIRVCIALLVIGAADAIYQKWKYIHDLKMTKQEVKEEHRSREGAPEIKSRIRQVQFKLTLKRMMQEVPKASVVLVNPTHVAVALRYDAKTMEAPVVVAKGADYLSEKIREIARSYGVPIIRRPELARAIYSTVEVGNPIPPNLYVAVAEILAMIYRLRHKKQK
jgi:flagellar biosynthetic protein FlhB